jgi:hypothetical protein
MTGSGQRGTQRIRYYDDQLLKAEDLQDDVAYEARMRELHVRTVHNTWGVALGFDIDVSKDGDAVLIGPGIAYNCSGRELISVRTLGIGLPAPPIGSQADAWWFDLVINYRGTADLLAGRSAHERCLGTGVSPIEEQPTWRWYFAGDATAEPPPILAEDVRLGDQVPLARFKIAAPRDGGRMKLVGKPDLSIRRNAQGLVRPHIAGGHLEGTFQHDPEQRAASLEVDTKAGGFSQTPRYFASLATHPFLAGTDPDAPDPEYLALLRLLLGPFLAIRAPSRDGFTLDVRFALSPFREMLGTTGLANMAVVEESTTAISEVLASRVVLPASVYWLGIESVGGCPPPWRLVQLFYLFTAMLSPMQMMVQDTMAWA